VLCAAAAAAVASLAAASLGSADPAPEPARNLQRTVPGGDVRGLQTPTLRPAGQLGMFLLALLPRNRTSIGSLASHRAAAATRYPALAIPPTTPPPTTPPPSPTPLPTPRRGAIAATLHPASAPRRPTT
jgi:hypothetical protein